MAKEDRTGKAMEKGRARAQTRIGTAAACAKMAGVIEGWVENKKHAYTRVATDNLEAHIKMRKGNFNHVGKLGELEAYLHKNEIEPVIVGKINKSNGKIEGFEEECKALSLRIKSLNEEADRRAKDTACNKEAMLHDKKIGTIEIEGECHHLSLSNWSRSVRNLREKKLMEKG